MSPASKIWAILCNRVNDGRSPSMSEISDAIDIIKHHDELVAAAKMFTAAEESWREHTGKSDVDDWLDAAYRETCAILAKVQS